MFAEVKNSPKISSCLNLAVMNWDSTQAQNILVMLRLICSQTRTVPAPNPHKSLMRWQSRVVTKFWEIQVTEEKKKSHLTQQELTEETEITGAGRWVFPPSWPKSPPDIKTEGTYTIFLIPGIFDTWGLGRIWKPLINPFFFRAGTRHNFFSQSSLGPESPQSSLTFVCKLN